jgi:hypothetical protein
LPEPGHDSIGSGPNIAVDRIAGSPPFAAAGHRDRSAQKRGESNSRRQRGRNSMTQAADSATTTLLRLARGYQISQAL